MAKARPKKERLAQNRKRLPELDTTPDAASFEKVLALLKDLEGRMSRIELHLGLGNTVQEVVPSAPGILEPGEESEDALETQVGENWFAKVGIVVLALGIVFLLTFPYQNLPSYAPSAIGYVLVGGIFALSRYWKRSFQQVSRYLLGGGLLLLYFTTLRLSHFGPTPALTNTPVELILLLAVVILNLRIRSRLSRTGPRI
jgi:hypothetical protein